MTGDVWFGIFGIGFVFGYLLFYAVKHTPQFSIDLLGGALGAVGGATVLGWLDVTPGWIGPYGTGIFVGFVTYLIMSVIILGPGPGNFDTAPKRKRFAQTLLGAPQQ
jgi:hypothetical protein